MLYSCIYFHIVFSLFFFLMEEIIEFLFYMMDEKQVVFDLVWNSLFVSLKFLLQIIVDWHDQWFQCIAFLQNGEFYSRKGELHID